MIIIIIIIIDQLLACCLVVFIVVFKGEGCAFMIVTAVNTLTELGYLVFTKSHLALVLFLFLIWLDL